MSRYGRMNRHHQSTDSDGLSLGTSPPPSPRHPVYYVQSPSRDSLYGETPTPGRSQELGRPRDAQRSRDFRSGELGRSQDFSPIDSPLHRSFVRASPAYSDSETRPFAPQTNSDSYAAHDVSNLKPGSRRVLPQPQSHASGSSRPGKGFLTWNPAVNAIEEEMEEEVKPLKPIYVYLLWALFVLVLFVIIVLIVWLVMRPNAPGVVVQKISLQQFGLGDGSDSSGVPSTLLTINTTVTMELHNPSRYVKMDYHSFVLQLFFQELDVADGQVPGFRQGKRSRVLRTGAVQSFDSPIHGAGATLQSLDDSGLPLPFRLVIGIRSSSEVIWKFIRPKFHKTIECAVSISKNRDQFYSVTQYTCA